jgi:aerobic carbon-monoxide dehydrogenase large subunit
VSTIPGTTGRYVGKSIRRVNDRRLVTGAGQFVDDVRLPGTLTGVFVRSPYAHAHINSIDTSAARDLEGVVTVLTGEDVTNLMKPLVTDHELPPHRHLERYPITSDKARFAGDAVAVVIADDSYVARDAAELVQVDYDPLPAITDPRKALEPEAP